MRRVLLLLLLLFSAAPASAAPEADLPTLGIVADDALGTALSDIARSYTREKRIGISLAFAGGGDAQALVEDSATADVLITARAHWVEELKAKGVLDIYFAREVARARLALVGPAASPLASNFAARFPVAALIRAMQGEALFIIGSPETRSEGTLARQALRRMDVLADMEPYTLYVKDFPQIIRLITTQDAYAVMYGSDAMRYPGIKIIGLLPETAHTPIVYRAVVLAGDRMDAARDFIRYLQTDTSQAIFAHYGLSLNP